MRQPRVQRPTFVARQELRRHPDLVELQSSAERFVEQMRPLERSEVAVHGAEADRLLGVRDGFLRYFHDGLDRPAPVAVVPQPAPAGEEAHDGLAMSDEEAIERARGRAHKLLERLRGHYHFYVCTEGGLHTVDLAGAPRYFVRTWTAVVGGAGEAFGGSGSVELPQRLVAGLSGEQLSM